MDQESKPTYLDFSIGRVRSEWEIEFAKVMERAVTEMRVYDDCTPTS